MRSRRGSLAHLLFAALLLVCLRAASSQSPAAQPSQASPLLSPEAAYDQAISTIDIVRRSQGNWSAIEINALNVAIQQAKDACAARASETYAGADLVSYARLCALGKQWSNAEAAAKSYIYANVATKPQLTEAYSYEIQAELSLGQEKDAVNACIEMLRSVPYSPLADDISTATIRYLQFAFTADALRVYANRQPILLHLLQTSQGDTAASRQSTSAVGSTPIHLVYQHALDFAALEQYDGEPEVAAALLVELDHVTPSSVAPDEAAFIAAARHQYSLLGTEFPELPGAISLMSAPATSVRQPRFGHPTVFFLFPAWCAQCIRQAQDMAAALIRTALVRGPGNEVNIYALLAAPSTGIGAAESSPESSPDRAGKNHRGAKQGANRGSGAVDKPTPPKSGCRATLENSNTRGCAGYDSGFQRLRLPLPDCHRCRRNHPTHGSGSVR